MPNNKKFKISDRTFSGYAVDLDMEYYDSLDQICTAVKNNLIQFLKLHNLEILENQAKQINFHIHDYSIEDILIADKENIFWCCNHC